MSVNSDPLSVEGEDGFVTPEEEPLPVRIGTVVWGFIVIGIAALFFVSSQIDLGPEGLAFLAVWAVLGIGVLAIVGGVIGAIFRHR